MGRYFNIAGPCNPADHYTLSAMARLPLEVRDCGITVDCASIERLGMINLWSRGGGIGRLEISDYVFETLRPELQRIHGVGGVETDGQRKAIRVWIDPFRCAAQSISSAEIVDDVPSHGELTE